MQTVNYFNKKAADLPLAQRLKLIASEIAGSVVFTTSFGLEDQAITYAIHAADVHNIELLTLDTGRLFNQTYDVWVATEARYNLKINAFSPKGEATENFIVQHGINGFYNSIENRKACCTIRKVEPLSRALHGADAWVTGLRGDQSDARSTVHFAEWDEARNLIKFNPLFDWSRDRVVLFTAENDIPVNALHAKGFISIGCAPCTRAILEGESERAGRWWWEDEAAKECGLHVNADGKLVRVEQVKNEEVFR